MSDVGHVDAGNSGADLGGVHFGTGAGVSSDSPGAGSAPPAPSYSPSGDFAQAKSSEPASGGLRDEDDESVDFFSGFETRPAEDGDPTSPLTPPVQVSDPTLTPPVAQPEPAAVAPPGGQAPPAAQADASAQVQPQGEALPETLEGFMTLATQNPQWVMENLAKNPEFIPSDEDMEALMSGDAPAVKQTFAQFAARMHYRSTMAAMNLINTWVPKLLSEGMQNQQREAEIRGQFKTQFPHLDLGNKQVMDLLTQTASQVKAIPGLSPQQRLQRVGLTVSALLGMPTAVGAPVAPQRQPGFVPASGGNAVPPVQSNGEVDMWGGLAREYDG
jgi:hypothetical protein